MQEEVSKSQRGVKGVWGSEDSQGRESDGVTGDLGGVKETSVGVRESGSGSNKQEWRITSSWAE